MESSIITANKLGNTKITGKCITKNPINGKEIVISEDIVDVHVVPLLNIEIKTPLIRIRSGAIMPASIWGKYLITRLTNEQVFISLLSFHFQ